MNCYFLFIPKRRATTKTYYSGILFEENIFYSLRVGLRFRTLGCQEKDRNRRFLLHQVNPSHENLKLLPLDQWSKDSKVWLKSDCYTNIAGVFESSRKTVRVLGISGQGGVSCSHFLPRIFPLIYLIFKALSFLSRLYLFFTNMQKFFKLRCALFHFFSFSI